MKMKMYPIRGVFAGKIIFSMLLLCTQFYVLQAQNTPLSLNGRLKLVGNQLCNEQGKAIQLRGMSSHGLQWFGNCMNNSSINALSKDWGADIVRAAMYVDEGGYLSNKQGMINKVNEMAAAAQQNGMYCLIDWHILNPGNPAVHVDDAKDFFRQMAQKYAGQKHILYEICNEPNNIDWGTVKWYAQQIIPIIRQYDSEAIIIVGTPTWSGEPMLAANDPITGGWAHNLMYTFHFYAGSHYNQSYLDGVLKRIPVFVTEWGTSNASGNGGNDYNNAQKWMDFLRGGNSSGIKVSWCNWSFSDKAESSAALNGGSCNSGQWNNTTYDGTWVKNHMLSPADDFGTTNTGGGSTGNSSGVTINGTTVIQAESYSDMSDVKTEATTDAGGGLDVGYINQGSWMKYSKITFPATGNYIVQYRVASVGGAKLSMDLNAGTIQLGAVNIPSTGGWQNWTTVTQTVHVNAGTYDVGIFAQTGNWNINWFSITSNAPITIQAENYSAMSDVQKQPTTDAGGGENVGYINQGSWMKYDKINFPVTGNYTVQYRVASVGGGKLSMDLNAGTIQLGSVNIPSTGGWQNWTTVTQTIHVNAGTYDVGIFAQTAGWNINWFTITPANSARTADDAQLADVTSDYNGFAAAAYFEVYPNPATDVLNLQATFNTVGGAIQIIDATGNVVLNTMCQSATISLSALPVGIYTLVYSKDGNKFVKRFVKN